MNQTELNKARIAEYNKAHVNDSAFSICDEWDESKHPRAANGQFGSGGATSSPTKASKAPAKANTSTPAKKPAQAKSTVSSSNGGSDTVDAFVQKFGHKVPAKEKQAIQDTCQAFKEWGDALQKAVKSPTAQNIVNMHNKGTKYMQARMKSTKFSEGGRNCVDHMLFTMGQHSGLSARDMQNADYMLINSDEPQGVKDFHRTALAKVKKAASKGKIVKSPNAEIETQSSLFV